MLLRTSIQLKSVLKRYLKSRSKDTFYITVRNQRFSRFLGVKKFQGQCRLHATPHDENSVHKPKCMIVMVGAVVVWLVSSNPRGDSRVLGIVLWTDPRMNDLDGP